ncbi:class I SAM-dependent methyltransferase [Spongiactinospora rosea]|uniref:class I SAM-dependent methyltransferase n=1 Tax=Spongiactinospora rosea TaxID=2248750 RepID=UPI0018F2E335|nr:class I SAM-dependent methyltransferase [Spongiactinospora rosea]
MVAVEPEPRLRTQAQVAAAEATIAVEVVPGVAEHLPVADQSVDAVVLCMVLCSLPDVGAALAEARRVLKPGGQVRLLEHGRAGTPGRLPQRAGRRRDPAVPGPLLDAGMRPVQGAGPVLAEVAVEQADRLTAGMVQPAQEPARLQ